MKKTCVCSSQAKTHGYLCVDWSALNGLEAVESSCSRSCRLPIELTDDCNTEQNKTKLKPKTYIHTWVFPQWVMLIDTHTLHLKFNDKVGFGGRFGQNRSINCTIQTIKSEFWLKTIFNTTPIVLATGVFQWNMVLMIMTTMMMTTIFLLATKLNLCWFCIKLSKMNDCAI